MGRARNPARNKAYDMWEKSDGKCKLKDIAAALGVLETQIRKWKSEDKWEQKKKEREKKGAFRKPAPKKGAPKGNKNAVGAGAKKGNQNSKKSGVYASLDLIMQGNVLTDEEKRYFELEDPIEVESELIILIKAYTIREYRILQEIDAYREADKAEITQRTAIGDKREFKTKEDEALYNQRIDEKVKSGARLPGERYSLTVVTEPKSKRLQGLEELLTRVQRAKKEAIAALHQVRTDQQGSAKNALADDWIAAMMENGYDES